METITCYDRVNPAGGFELFHNGRCARGMNSPEVHLRATHHVLAGPACMQVCEQCARELAKRKDAIVRELTAEELSQ